MLSLVDEYFQNLLMKWCSLVPPPNRNRYQSGPGRGRERTRFFENTYAAQGLDSCCALIIVYVCINMRLQFSSSERRSTDAVVKHLPKHWIPHIHIIWICMYA